MTEEQIGAIIAKRVWRHLQDMKCMELVPWNSIPIDQARQQGREEAIAEIERVIIEWSEELRSS